ncbi:hypothetical protein ACF0H5_004553 [Mactra antiquata]
MLASESTSSQGESQSICDDSIKETFDHSYCKYEDRSKDEQADQQLTSLDYMQLSSLKEESNPVDPMVKEIISQISSNKTIMQAVQAHILEDIDMHCSTLVSRTAAFGSVLSRYRSVNSLVDNGDKILLEIVREMSERLPFVLDLFTRIVTAGKEPVESKVSHVAAAYAILMNGRNEQLSAWHRLTTFIAIQGQLNDTAMTRLNHLGLTLSTTSKLRLLDEAGNRMETSVASIVLKNPIVKITGDNLDIYVRTGHKSLERTNQDMHLFASNIIFSRVGRILMEFTPFKWMSSVVPSHIYHPYQKQMSEQTQIFQLPIQMKNEAKHEDCVDILDGYEDVLTEIFNQAFGSDELLKKNKVVVGGDQLTRVRFEEAKLLRALATSPKKRFDDLQPFVVELWHVKQDFLEKCYKEMYKSTTLRQPGTLFHYKSKLQRSDVNGKVKGSFKPHYDLISIVGKAMVTEQFLEYFGMDTME